MHWVLRVHVDVEPAELSRFTDPAVQHAVNQAVASMGATAKVVGLQMPATVDIQFSGPTHLRADVEKLVSAVRIALKLKPGAARALQVPGSASQLKFGGVRGGGRICSVCGGIDGKHDQSKHK